MRHPVFAFMLVGHFLFHALFSSYFMIILAIQVAWGVGYGELVSAWTLAAAILGIAGPFAGFLADRLGERILMLLFFFGVSAASLIVAYSETVFDLAVTLSILALFGSIYHPVGIPWALRTSAREGIAAGWLGIAGSLGVSASPLLVSVLLSLHNDWRAIYWYYAVCFLIAGVALLATPTLDDPRTNRSPEAKHIKGSPVIWVFVFVSLAMFFVSVSYNAISAYLPKYVASVIFPESVSISDTSIIVSVIFLIAASGQWVAGKMIDSWGSLYVFTWTLGLKAIVLIALSAADQWVALWLCVGLFFLFDMGSPSEAVLISENAPPDHRNFMFGVRNSFSVLAAPIGVSLLAQLGAEQDASQNSLFFLIFAGCLVSTCIPLIWLARRRRGQVATAERKKIGP